MSKVHITAQMVADGYCDTWCYRDAFKSLNGFRPNSEYWNTNEYIADFWNRFDEEFDRVQEEERQQLVALGEHYGQEFASWSTYYDFVEAREWAEIEARAAARKQAAAERAEFFRRGSPLPVIEAWEHGDRLAA